MNTPLHVLLMYSTTGLSDYFSTFPQEELSEVVQMHIILLPIWQILLLWNGMYMCVVPFYIAHYQSKWQSWPEGVQPPISWANTFVANFFPCPFFQWYTQRFIMHLLSLQKGMTDHHIVCSHIVNNNSVGNGADHKKRNRKKRPQRNSAACSHFFSFMFAKKTNQQELILGGGGWGMRIPTQDSHIHMHCMGAAAKLRMTRCYITKAFVFQTNKMSEKLAWHHQKGFWESD